MNRLYVVENHYTGSGWPRRSSLSLQSVLIGEFARQLSAKIVAATGDGSWPL